MSDRFRANGRGTPNVGHFTNESREDLGERATRRNEPICFWVAKLLFIKIFINHTYIRQIKYAYVYFGYLQLLTMNLRLIISENIPTYVEKQRKWDEIEAYLEQKEHIISQKCR